VRVEALDTLGRAVIERLLTGSLPEPAVIARDLGPLIAERRLLFWTDNADEQELLERTGLLGSIPALGDDGGFSVSVTTRGRARSTSSSIATSTCGRDRRRRNRRLIADVTLTNNAPSSGLPAYVIGNNYGEPTGLELATRNGQPFDPTPQPEAGWIGYGFDDVIAPGASVEYHLEFTLKPVSSGADDPVVWTQPLAQR
jgi:hypothetical protein